MPRRSNRIAATSKAEAQSPLPPAGASDENTAPQTPARTKATAGRREQFTLSPQGEDALGIKAVVRKANPHYLSASKLKKTKDGYRTKTPGRRLFKILMQFTVRDGDERSSFKVLQPENFQEREAKHPPVVHDGDVNVTPPREATKSVAGFVRPADILALRKTRRKGTGTFYKGHSANDMGTDDGHRRVHSHLAPVKQIGEQGRAGTVVATEGQNVTQCAVENAAASTMLSRRFDLTGLECRGDATVTLDADGEATHIGERQTLAYSSPGDSRSVKADFDSTNPNAARAGVRQLFSRTVFPGLFHPPPTVNRTLSQDDAATESSEIDTLTLG